MVEAQFTLASCYFEGSGEEEKEAPKWVRKAADQGHAGAQYMLGILYSYSYFGMKNEVESRKWFLRAGAKGNESLGKLCSLLERDEKALESFLKEAKKVEEEVMRNPASPAKGKKSGEDNSTLGQYQNTRTPVGK